MTNQFKFHPLAKPATYAALALAVNGGKYDEAIKAFPKLGQPKNELTPLVLYGLGVAYRGAKNDAAAISNFDLFRKQYANAPEIPQLYFHLALAFRSQGNLAASKSNINLLLNGYVDAPMRLIALQELVGIANQEKDKSAFVATSLQVIKEFGSSARIDENRFALAKSYYDDGKKSDAAANFEPLLKDPYMKSPRRPEALVYLARMAVESGDRTQIRKWGVQLVKEQPTHSLSIQLLPELLRFAYLDKDYSGAAAMAEAIKQNTSLDIEIRRDAIKYLILIYDLKAPDSQKALNAYQDFFRLNPPDGFEKLSTLRDYNKLLEKMGRKDILKDTVQTVYEATRQPSDKSTNAFQLAQLYEPTDKAKALQFYELAVSLQPDSKNAIPALQTAARLGVELGQSAKADFIVAKIIRNYPDKEPAPASYLLLAQAHEKAGNKSEAVKNYKRVSEGYPSSSEARTASDALKKLQ
ncbi:MAG: tetratricopeptide repeat protein [Spirochaetia bacterium]|nr:tetratricopeptide repeat protein [Spirochaetia bacterium]